VFSKAAIVIPIETLTVTFIRDAELKDTIEDRRDVLSVKISMLSDDTRLGNVIAMLIPRLFVGISIKSGES